MAANDASILNSIQDVLFHALNLSQDARFEKDGLVDKEETTLQIDYLIRDKNKTFYVEIANTASIQHLSRLALIKLVLTKEDTEHVFVLAAKHTPVSVIELAGRLNILTIQLPYSIPIFDSKDDGGRITTEKAWKAVTEILSLEMTSINSISKRSAISYGWTHRIVNRLVDRKLATRNHDFIRISDEGGLLNAVAMERPLIELNCGVIQSDFESSFDAAVDLTKGLQESGWKFAFTAYTAASIYTGYSVRHDAVYIYIESREKFLELKKEEKKVLGRIRIHVYLPDRDVFSSSAMKNGIRIVSKPQALLDIAGMGLSGRDLALQMMRTYGTIPSSND